MERTKELITEMLEQLTERELRIVLALIRGMNKNR